MERGELREDSWHVVKKWKEESGERIVGKCHKSGKRSVCKFRNEKVINLIYKQKMEEVKFNFEDLKVYQKALDFADYAYELTARFPDRERYGLSSQFNRAANSIALNTSEGSGDTDSQFHRFLQIAEDSVRECVTCSTIAFRRNFITKEENQKARVMLLELLKMIRSLQRYLKSKK